MNINLFPEIDSCWYIHNASEKHHPLEFHTYKSMACFCFSHHFCYEPFNRMLDRRSIIIKYRQIEKKTFQNIVLSPLRVFSVKLNHDGCDEEEVSKDTNFIIDPPEQEVNFLLTLLIKV